MTPVSCVSILQIQQSLPTMQIHNVFVLSPLPLALLDSDGITKSRRDHETARRCDARRLPEITLGGVIWVGPLANRSADPVPIKARRSLKWSTSRLWSELPASLLLFVWHRGNQRASTSPRQSKGLDFRSVMGRRPVRIIVRQELAGGTASLGNSRRIRRSDGPVVN